jgi:methylated-DNA-[protein]-cysteine S-methyltransferase
MTTFAFESPLGLVRITGSERGVSDITFVEVADDLETDVPASLSQCAAQLLEYFDGTRKDFDTFPLAIRGTDFQQRVWEIASKIPFGSTMTYGEIARELDIAEGGAQAVGNALNRNPICIVIPCHRILPASGEIGGYAGGAWRKEWLLKHEKNPVS